MKRISDKHQTGLLLLLVLLAGLLLRFWHYNTIPFTFDELSAMSRTQFDNLYDLIRIGVIKLDTHPAGVQVFLYYWVKLFGESEPVVKLPFLLAGLASVYVAYRIGKLWFNETAGMLTAAYMSSLQLFVMYSQIARPYASGLFLCLVMVFFWSRYFFEGGKIKDLAWFVLFAALASYNHHFSLLFAAIVGLSGLWLVTKKTFKLYLFSGVALFILYIPHLPIFFSQLQKGGVGGWLAKPSPWFLLNFLQWLFHYSFWVIAVLILLIVFVSFYQKEKNERVKNMRKKRIFLLLWFLLPVIIGYLYSVWIDPIIQYSMLIFSTPYLFIFLFSYSGKVKPKVLALPVVLLLTVNILTLVVERQYYKVFYKQPFETMVKDALTLEKKNPGNVLIINNYVPYYTEYYFRKFDQTLPYFTVRNKNLSIPEFQKVLAGIKENTVITSGLGSMYFQLIKGEFPYWTGYNRGFTFEEYVFSKDAAKHDKELKRTLITEFDLPSPQELWNYKKEHVLFDTVINAYVYMVSPQTKYDLKTKQQLEDMMGDIYEFIDVEAEVKIEDPQTDAALVTEIKEKKNTIRWLAVNLSDFGLIPGVWQKVYLTIDMQIAMKNKNRINKDQVFRCFIWNKNGRRFYIKNINIYERPGNSYRYVLFTKIPKISNEVRK